MNDELDFMTSAQLRAVISLKDESIRHLRNTVSNLQAHLELVASRQLSRADNLAVIDKALEAYEDTLVREIIR